MLVIRLLRTGKKNQPSFKIVVVESSESSVSGRFVEEVGFYNPLTKEKVLKEDRIKYWISSGAQPSPTVHNLLVSSKIVQDQKMEVHKKSKKTDKPETSTPAEEKAEAVEGEKPVATPEDVKDSVEEVKATEEVEEVKEENVSEPVEKVETETVSEPAAEVKEEAAPEPVVEEIKEEVKEEVPAEEAPIEEKVSEKEEISTEPAIDKSEE